MPKIKEITSDHQAKSLPGSSQGPSIGKPSSFSPHNDFFIRHELASSRTDRCAFLADPICSAPTPGSSCPIDIICETSQGKAFQLLATAQTDKDLTKNPPVGSESLGSSFSR